MPAYRNALQQSGWPSPEPPGRGAAYFGLKVNRNVFESPVARNRQSVSVRRRPVVEVLTQRTAPDLGAQPPREASPNPQDLLKIGGTSHEAFSTVPRSYRLPGFRATVRLRNYPYIPTNICI